jgi:hypothetical protein
MNYLQAIARVVAYTGFRTRGYRAPATFQAALTGLTTPDRSRFVVVILSAARAIRARPAPAQAAYTSAGAAEPTGRVELSRERPRQRGRGREGEEVKRERDCAHEAGNRPIRGGPEHGVGPGGGPPPPLSC